MVTVWCRSKIMRGAFAENIHFARFRLYDLDKAEEHEFALKDLHKNVRLFGFIAGYESKTFTDQDPVNIKAAEKLGSFL